MEPGVDISYTTWVRTLNQKEYHKIINRKNKEQMKRKTQPKKKRKYKVIFVRAKKNDGKTLLTLFEV